MEKVLMNWCETSNGNAERLDWDENTSIKFVISGPARAETVNDEESVVPKKAWSNKIDTERTKTTACGKKLSIS